MVIREDLTDVFHRMDPLWLLTRAEVEAAMPPAETMARWREQAVSAEDAAYQVATKTKAHIEAFYGGAEGFAERRRKLEEDYDAQRKTDELKAFMEWKQARGR